MDNAETENSPAPDTDAVKMGIKFRHSMDDRELAIARRSIDTFFEKLATHEKFPQELKPAKAVFIHEALRSKHGESQGGDSDVWEVLRSIGIQDRDSTPREVFDYLYDNARIICDALQSRASEANDIWWRVHPSSLAIGVTMELISFESDLRNGIDWQARWCAAGGKLYGTDKRMIAMISDPIWRKISAFGEPIAPLDYSSSSIIREVLDVDAAKLGVFAKTTSIV